MPNPWFRMYFEFADDPKVQIMSEAMQRRLVMLFCERCKEETLHETERSFHWRISETELAETKELFLAKGFIDKQWNLLNWNTRQFISDSSTERVRQHRERLKQNETLQKQDISVTVTPPEADTESEEDISDATHPHPGKQPGNVSPNELIYQAYPRKEAHGAAIASIKKAVTKLVQGKDAARKGPMKRRDAQVLLYKAVMAYARSPVGQQPDKTKIPHPTTWFNQERWGDDQENWKQIQTIGNLNGKIENNLTATVGALQKLRDSRNGSGKNSTEIIGNSLFPGSAGDRELPAAIFGATIEGKI